MSSALKVEYTNRAERRITKVMTAPDAKSLPAIAHRLRATREALGLSQAEFCRRAGIATNTYNQYERAKGRPELDKAMAICEAFHLTLDWIYRGDASQIPHALARSLTPEAIRS
jgi:transcriptional regulator with XRE-family HTH domain